MGLLIISSMMVLGGMYLIFAFVWWILQIIANWNIFTKAGEAGWKSLIPIYGDYVSYKIAWQTSYFWLRAFGRGIGFAIGLILLQPIFLLILGFGSDQYYGADR